MAALGKAAVVADMQLDLRRDGGWIEKPLQHGQAACG
jgi:hypothetical protein